MTRKQIRPCFKSLKAWRKAMTYTQQDAAALLGISQALYSRWETGVMRPKPKTAQTVARKTGVPILDLLGVAA